MPHSVDDRLCDALIDITNQATLRGIHENDQVLALLLTALGIADRHARGGVSREDFVRMAGSIHDQLRKALVTDVRN